MSLHVPKDSVWTLDPPSCMLALAARHFVAREAMARQRQVRDGSSWDGPSVISARQPQADSKHRVTNLSRLITEEHWLKGGNLIGNNGILLSGTF